MKFSILVPVYNVEKYLEQCVESLLNQTYKDDYEIILVDDGSTDSSGMICDRYAKNKPDKVKVVHKKNEGLVSARQAGIKIASGEYSLFADSDDFVETNLLETVNDCIKRNDDPDMVIYSFNYFLNNKKIKKKNTLFHGEEVFTEKNKRTIYDAIITTNFITSLWTKVLKTEILKNDPTDYSLYYDKNMAEDWFRSIHLITCAKKIVCIDKALYNYRMNEESISRSYKAETIEKKNVLYVYDRFLEYLPIWGMSDEKNIQILNARFLNEAMSTFSKYCEKVPLIEMDAILNYDWSSMLPVAAQNDTNNPHENKLYRGFYTLLLNKKMFKLKTHFIRKRIYNFLRKIKSAFKNTIAQI